MRCLWISVTSSHSEDSRFCLFVLRFTEQVRVPQHNRRLLQGPVARLPWILLVVAANYRLDHAGVDRERGHETWSIRRYKAAGGRAGPLTFRSNCLRGILNSMSLTHGRQTQQARDMRYVHCSSRGRHGLAYNQISCNRDTGHSDYIHACLEWYNRIYGV